MSAKWVVVVQHDASKHFVDGVEDMHIGPFTSERIAENLARRVNTGLEGLSASVEGLYPPRDRDTKSDLYAMAGQRYLA